MCVLCRRGHSRCSSVPTACEAASVPQVYYSDDCGASWTCFDGDQLWDPRIYSATFTIPGKSATYMVGGFATLSVSGGAWRRRVPCMFAVPRRRWPRGSLRLQHRGAHAYTSTPVPLPSRLAPSSRTAAAGWGGRGRRAPSATAQVSSRPIRGYSPSRRPAANSRQTVSEAAQRSAGVGCAR